MSSGIKVVYGAAPFAAERPFFNSKEVLEELFSILKEAKVTTLDTAQLYAGSEALLGEANAASQFTIDSKIIGGFAPGSANKDNVIKTVNESLKKLKTDSVDIFYIHAPDRQTPFKETLEALNELHKQGKFKRLGLSNFKPEEVEEVIRLSKENNFVPPSVYQGNYSPVARKQETTLFPILRKNNIAFYAYSPMAGGFLTKTKQQIQEGAGRFDDKTPLGQIYGPMYNKPSLLEALEKWNAIAESEGIPKAELAYRWVTYNSILKPEYGDAIIVGARNFDQSRETLKGIKNGPLSEKATKAIEEVWKSVEAEAPIDNYNSSHAGSG